MWILNILVPMFTAFGTTIKWDQIANTVLSLQRLEDDPWLVVILISIPYTVLILVLFARQRRKARRVGRVLKYMVIRSEATMNQIQVVERKD